MITQEEDVKKDKKKRKKTFWKKYTKTSAIGMFKDKKTGFIINRNKNELLLTKAATKNAKKQIEAAEKVKNLENQIEELKNILIKVVERN